MTKENNLLSVLNTVCEKIEGHCIRLINPTTKKFGVILDPFHLSELVLSGTVPNEAYVKLSDGNSLTLSIDVTGPNLISVSYGAMSIIDTPQSIYESVVTILGKSGKKISESNDATFNNEVLCNSTIVLNTDNFILTLCGWEFVSVEFTGNEALNDQNFFDALASTIQQDYICGAEMIFSDSYKAMLDTQWQRHLNEMKRLSA